jgi:hypothetical protein
MTEKWIAPRVALIGYRSPLKPLIAGTGLAAPWPGGDSDACVERGSGGA